MSEKEFSSEVENENGILRAENLKLKDEIQKWKNGERVMFEQKIKISGENMALYEVIDKLIEKLG